MRTFKEKVCKYCGQSYIPTGSSSYFCCLDHRRKYYIEQGIAKEYRDRFNLKNGVQVGIGSGGTTGSWDQNHMYKNGSGSFRNYGRKLKEAGVPCNRCGKDLTDAKRGEWCSHHKDHNRSNNTIENLELLCKRCHQMHHDAGYKSLPSLMKVQRLSRQGVADTSSEAPNSEKSDDDIV